MEQGKTHTLQRASRSTWLILMMGVGFCAGGLSLARQGQVSVGLGLAVGFGIMGVVAFLTVLPGANSLSYDDQGFWTTWLFRRGDRIPWTSVSKFHVAPVEGKPRVVFNFSDPEVRATDFRGAIRGAADWGGSLPDDYGQETGELARELNARRDHAVGADA